jgi:hypothetical protein
VGIGCCKMGGLQHDRTIGALNLRRTLLQLKVLEDIIN